ncbi:MAG TPA: site-specific integrase [Myxococcota bacterium]|nr:site-specific integrase [Myxococcota bacterium]
MLPRGKLASARRHLYLIQRILQDLGPATPLEALSTPVLSRWRDDLLAGGLKPATVNRHLDLVKATLHRAAREWGALATPPFVRSVPEKNQRTRFLSDEEEALLLASSPPYLRDLLVFLLDTGARVGEALGLVWGDVDLDRTPNGVAFFLETKSDKPRGVPLTRRARATLAARASHGPPPADFVFTRPPLAGQRLEWDAVKTAFRRARERTGLRDVTLHTLRHTYASRLVLRGVSLYQVQKLLGHSSPIMTQRYALSIRLGAKATRTAQFDTMLSSLP